MKARTRMTGVLAVAAAATAFGLTLPHLIAGGAASSTQHDAEVAAVNEVQEEEKRQPIRFVAERGTLSDFLSSRIVELAEGIWIVGRAPDVAVVIAQDDTLRAYSTDVEAADPAAVARIERGTPQAFMDALARFVGVAAELGGESDPCANFMDQTPPLLSCCMRHYQEGSQDRCFCVSSAQCHDNGGVCIFETTDPSGTGTFGCRMKCCDAVN